MPDRVAEACGAGQRAGRAAGIAMRLRGVSFDNWLRSPDHRDKKPKERWLRELYPWPVLAQVDCDERLKGRVQSIEFDDADFDVTLVSVDPQPKRDTFKYLLHIESDGLGWQSRPYADDFYMHGKRDGRFATVYHAKKKKEEPLETTARAFFSGRWQSIDADSFANVAVSRFLAASLVDKMVTKAWGAWGNLDHYPSARLVGGASPMLASGNDLWIGYRYYSEGAHAWARQCAGQASRVVALYFAPTKYQFRTDLPDGAEVMSVTELDDIRLGGEYEELIRVLLRKLELPHEARPLVELDPIVRGRVDSPEVGVTDADVHEALAALKRACASKAQLRYQLAAGVLLNRWIEEERRRGRVKRKKFYASFKPRIRELASWAREAGVEGVNVWADRTDDSCGTPVTYVRMDGVDFSYHDIPDADEFLASGPDALTWSGVRLKPIAPLVLEWARLQLPGNDGSEIGDQKVTSRKQSA